MEKYIDREKLIKELIDKGFYPAIVKSAIENAPTEDVVPRKQSEDWKEIAIAYQKQFEDTYEDKQMAIKQAKQKVAREIFEEIEKSIHNNYIDLADNVPNDDDYYLGKFAGISEAETIIAEYEKKYIGE